MQNKNTRAIKIVVDGVEKLRKDYIRELFVSGMSRGEIKKHLEENFDQQILFQQVYQATSDLQNDAQVKRGRNCVMLTSKSGEQIARRDLIKQLYSEGKSRSEIVKILASDFDHIVAFQIIYQATA